MTKKWVNGLVRDLTAEEQAEFDARNKEWEDGALDRALKYLRHDRDYLLAKTDWTALSDNTMSDKMKQYRSDLRDITEGLTTVEEVEAVEFPTKP